VDLVHFTRVASGTFKSTGGASTGELGHLLRPIPLEQAAGVWLARDYRGPVIPGTESWNAVLIVIVGLFALVGLAFDLRGRRPSVALLVAVAALVALLMSPRVSPYADSKLLVVLSPALVLAAAVGAFWLVQLGGRLPRVLGVAGAAATALGVFWSDGLAYHGVRLAPTGRMDAMEDAAAHSPRRGLLMVNEWEEFAKYFMRDRRVNPAFETGSPKSAGLRKPQDPLFGFYYDLDAELIGFVTQFPSIVVRHSPSASRPPASFTKAYSNAYYEVWRRRPGIRVREHLPLQSGYRATAVAPCGPVARIARRARPGDRIIAAQRPETIQLDTAHAGDRPYGWPPDQARPGLVTPTAGGTVSRQVTAPAARYRVWVRGSFGRPLDAKVDGRTVGTVKGVNTPGQWLEAGTVALRAGSHRLELERPGGWISPGNGYDGEIGPLALDPIRPERLISVPPARAASLCGKRWDWIELVGRG
jgi:hypothetical protein